MKGYCLFVMRATSIKQKAKAFSLVELLVVLATLVVLAALVLPKLAGSRKATMITCLNQLKQVGLAFVAFATDHNDQFPMQTSVTNGGSMEFVGSGSPAPHFQMVSKYLRGDWRVLICPTDKAKARAADHAVLSDRNISYFLSMDATYGSPSSILAGDRNLEVTGQPVKPGLFSLSTNAAVSWTSELHNDGGNPLGGNLLFADGHAEVAGRKLPAVIQRQNLATNRLVIP
jgi:prepilin-type processing-associated H-X9-DG protein